jgi:tRNA dimethylallyltransferase
MGIASKPCVIAIVGPTASGKTTAALQLAHELPCEIISMDSALVYRGMDVGTAKPSATERASVPHHLIDLIDPRDAYSAMQFRRDALSLIADITARGKMPVIVGGTMLYLKALRDGLDALPAADPSLRARLDQERAELGVAALHARLANVDPVTAARLDPSDTQRIQRALEVFALSGVPISALQSGVRDTDTPLDLLALSLEPSDRSVLHARIATRFDAMLDPLSGGLIEEVERLRARGDLHAGLPSMRCVGYRQTWEYLDGMIDRATLREKGIAATRQLAKRQLTWLRATPGRIVLDCLDPHAQEAVLRHGLAFADAAENTV